MPRETIGYDGNRTVVKWCKDDDQAEFPNTPGNVQIGTINPANDDDTQSGAAGLFSDVDADEIDYLISVLRKAKRQAFPQPTHPGGVVTLANESVLPPLTNDQVQLMVSQVTRRGNLR